MLRMRQPTLKPHLDDGRIRLSLLHGFAKHPHSPFHPPDISRIQSSIRGKHSKTQKGESGFHRSHKTFSCVKVQAQALPVVFNGRSGIM
jgi:hypothetical protein